MGYRAYVIKAGSVDENTGAEFFNRRSCEILDLFDNYNIRYENDYRKLKDRWTIKDTELNALIAILEDSPNEVNECFSDDMDKALTNQELADGFREWVKEADKESGLIRIYWS